MDTPDFEKDKFGVGGVLSERAQRVLRAAIKTEGLDRLSKRAAISANAIARAGAGATIHKSTALLILAELGELEGQ